MNLSDSIHTYLTTAPTSLFVQQAVEMVEGWEGHDNLLWRVKSGQQDAVLKLYLDAGQARSRRQFDGHLHFAPLGLAPRPLWYDRHPHGLSRQVMIYEWVEGEKTSRQGDRERVRLAEVAAQVHSRDAADVQRFCPHPLNLEIFWRVERSGIRPIDEWLTGRKALSLQRFFQKIATACQRLVDGSLVYWQQSPPTAVHGDLQLANAITTPFGSTVLLDWEMFGLGDPSLEIASFLQRNEVNSESWLKHYLSLVDQPFLSQRIDIYRQLLPFQSLCYLFNGLKAMARAKGEPESAAALPFLFDTIEATIDHIANLFGIEHEVGRNEIEKLGEQPELS